MSSTQMPSEVGAAMTGMRSHTASLRTPSVPRVPAWGSNREAWARASCTDSAREGSASTATTGHTSWMGVPSCSSRGSAAALAVPPASSASSRQPASQRASQAGRAEEVLRIMVWPFDAQALSRSVPFPPCLPAYMAASARRTSPWGSSLSSGASA